MWFILKKIMQYIALTIFLPIFFSSCEKEYVPDVDLYKDVIVLNSFISPDTNLILHLSNSNSSFSAIDILPILNAQIYLETQDSLITTNFYYLGKGNYISDYVPIINNNYKINVSHENFINVISESYIPKNVIVDSYYSEVKTNSENDNVLESRFSISYDKEVYLIFRHIVDKKYLSIYQDTISYTDTVWIQRVDDLFESLLPNYAINNILFTHLKEGGRTNIFLQSRDGFVKDEQLISGTSIFEIFTCSEDYYKYQKSLQIYNWNKEDNNSSIVNPSSIYNNIENGLGVFAGFNKIVLTNKYK